MKYQHNVSQTTKKAKILRDENLLNSHLTICAYTNNQNMIFVNLFKSSSVFSERSFTIIILENIVKTVHENIIEIQHVSVTLNAFFSFVQNRV